MDVCISHTIPHAHVGDYTLNAEFIIPLLFKNNLTSHGSISKQDIFNMLVLFLYKNGITLYVFSWELPFSPFSTMDLKDNHAFLYGWSSFSFTIFLCFIVWISHNWCIHSPVGRHWLISGLRLLQIMLQRTFLHIYAGICMHKFLPVWIFWVME